MKRNAINLLLVGLSIFAAVFLSEIIARLVITGKIEFEIGSTHDLFASNEHLGWMNKPGADCYYRNDLIGVKSKVTFDENGLRENGQTPIETIEKKILIVGDSVTAGIEVDNNKTFVALLEALFQKTGYHFRFYNAGVRGYGTDQAYLNCIRLNNIIRPDFIVYMFCSNDFGDNRTVKKANRIYGKPVFIMENEKLWLVHCPVQKYPVNYYKFITYPDSGYKIVEGNNFLKTKYFNSADRFLTHNMALFNLLKVAFYKFGEKTKKKRHGKMLEKDLRLLSMLLNKFIGMNKNFIFTASPRGGDIPHEQFERISKKLNIAYLNISPYFDTKMEYRYKYNPHWNELGHLTAAKALYKMLQPILTANLIDQPAAGN